VANGISNFQAAEIIEIFVYFNFITKSTFFRVNQAELCPNKGGEA
jgi:hypothetical protein